MSDPAQPFKSKGVMSMKDACLIVFRGMEPGEWISTDEMVARVVDLTEYEHEASSVTGAAWSAMQVMAAECEGSARAYMGGYQRLDTAGKVEAVDRYVEKTKNDALRSLLWAANALVDPELPPEDRQRMQDVHRAEQWQRELEDRRAQRRRRMGEE